MKPQLSKKVLRRLWKANNVSRRSTCVIGKRAIRFSSTNESFLPPHYPKSGNNVDVEVLEAIRSNSYRTGIQFEDEISSLCRGASLPGLLHELDHCNGILRSHPSNRDIADAMSYMKHVIDAECARRQMSMSDAHSPMDLGRFKYVRIRDSPGILIDLKRFERDPVKTIVNVLADYICPSSEHDKNHPYRSEYEQSATQNDNGIVFIEGDTEEWQPGPLLKIPSWKTLRLLPINLKREIVIRGGDNINSPLMTQVLSMIQNEMQIRMEGCVRTEEHGNFGDVNVSDEKTVDMGDGSKSKYSDLFPKTASDSAAKHDALNGIPGPISANDDVIIGRLREVIRLRRIIGHENAALLHALEEKANSKNSTTMKSMSSQFRRSPNATTSFQKIEDSVEGTWWNKSPYPNDSQYHHETPNSETSNGSKASRRVPEAAPVRKSSISESESRHRGRSSADSLKSPVDSEKEPQHRSEHRYTRQQSPAVTEGAVKPTPVARNRLFEPTPREAPLPLPTATSISKQSVESMADVINESLRNVETSTSRDPEYMSNMMDTFLRIWYGRDEFRRRFESPDAERILKSYVVSGTETEMRIANATDVYVSQEEAFRKLCNHSSDLKGILNKDSLHFRQVTDAMKPEEVDVSGGRKSPAFTISTPSTSRGKDRVIQYIPVEEHEQEELHQTKTVKSTSEALNSSKNEPKAGAASDTPTEIHVSTVKREESVGAVLETEAAQPWYVQLEPEEADYMARYGGSTEDLRHKKISKNTVEKRVNTRYNPWQRRELGPLSTHRPLRYFSIWTHGTFEKIPRELQMKNCSRTIAREKLLRSQNISTFNPTIAVSKKKNLGYTPSVAITAGVAELGSDLKTSQFTSFPVLEAIRNSFMGQHRRSFSTSAPRKPSSIDILLSKHGREKSGRVSTPETLSSSTIKSKVQSGRSAGTIDALASAEAKPTSDVPINHISSDTPHSEPPNNIPGRPLTVVEHVCHMGPAPVSEQLRLERVCQGDEDSASYGGIKVPLDGLENIASSSEVAANEGTAQPFGTPSDRFQKSASRDEDTRGNKKRFPVKITEKKSMSVSGYDKTFRSFLEYTLCTPAHMIRMPTPTTFFNKVKDL